MAIGKTPDTIIPLKAIDIDQFPYYMFSYLPAKSSQKQHSAVLSKKLRVLLPSFCATCEPINLWLLRNRPDGSKLRKTKKKDVYPCKSHILPPSIAGKGLFKEDIWLSIFHRLPTSHSHGFPHKGGHQQCQHDQPRKRHLTVQTMWPKKWLCLGCVVISAQERYKIKLNIQHHTTTYMYL